MRAELPSHITSKDIYQFSGLGEIYSHTTVYESKYVPERFKDFVPYSTAIIRLKEGPLITAQLTDFGDEKPEIGMQVEMVTRFLGVEGDPDRGLRVYGYKFRPLLEKAA